MQPGDILLAIDNVPVRRGGERRCVSPRTGLARR